MATSTSRLELTEIMGVDPPSEYRLAINNHAAALDGAVTYSQDYASNLPTTGWLAGREFYATDTGGWYKDNGGAWVRMATYTTYVTSLPLLPYDGQEIYFLAGTLVHGERILWHFRYNIASPGYKWEFVGGPPLYASNGGDTGGLTSSYAAPSGYSCPTITIPTLPTGGTFDVTLGAWLTGGTGGQNVYASYTLNGYAANDTQSISLQSLGAAAYLSLNLVQTQRITNVNSASTIAARYRVDGAYAGQLVGNTFLSVTPVAVM